MSLRFPEASATGGRVGNDDYGLILDGVGWLTAVLNFFLVFLLTLSSYLWILLRFLFLSLLDLVTDFLQSY